MTEVITAISTVGFPICCVLLLFWYINNTQKELINQMVEISKQIALLVAKVGGKEDDEE